MKKFIQYIQHFFSRLFGNTSNNTNHASHTHTHERTNTNNTDIPAISNYRPAHNAPHSQKFQDAYLDYNNYSAYDVWKLIGGGLHDSYGDHGTIEDVANTCATRISRGLNYSGAKIPKGSIGANRNYDGKTPGDHLYYIIQARKLRRYLRKAWGAPNQTLTHPKQIQMLKDTLHENQYAIIVSNTHAGAVSPTYEDNYVRYYLGDMWILPL